MLQVSLLHIAFLHDRIKKIILFIILSTLSISSIAQLRFQKYLPATYQATIFEQTDGTYRIIYNTLSGGGACPATIHFVKLDSACNLIYQKDFTAGYCDESYDVVQKDNEFIIGGFSASTTDTMRRAIFKIDLEGNLIWHGKYQSVYSYTNFVEFGNNDSAVGVGVYIPPSMANKYGIYLFKTSGLGNLEWGKVYYSSFDIYPSQKFLTTNDGCYMIGGSFGSPPYSTNILLKTNSSGTILWSKAYYSNAGKLCQFFRMLKKPNGEICVIGNTIDSTGNYYNPIIVRLDPNGNIIESKAFNYSSFVPWTSDSFLNTSDSGFVFLAETTLGMSMYKLDGNLNLKWIKLFTNAFQTFNLRQTSDEGYIFTSYSPDSWGNTRYVIIKTDKYGSSGCNDRDTTATEYPIPIYDSTITLSSFNEGVRYPTSITTSTSSVSIIDLCFCNPESNFTYSTNGTDITFTNTSNNTFNSFWSFGDGTYSNDISPTHSYNTSGTYQVVLVTQDGNCYDTIQQTIQIDEIDYTFSLYPNPNNGSFVIKYSIDKNSEFYLYNTLGQIVYEKQILPGINQKTELQLMGLASGVYEMKLSQTKNILYNTRIVIIR